MLGGSLDRGLLAHTLVTGAPQALVQGRRARGAGIDRDEGDGTRPIQLHATHSRRS